MPIQAHLRMARANISGDAPRAKRALAAKGPAPHELASKTAQAFAVALVWGSITHAMDHTDSIA